MDLANGRLIQKIVQTAVQHRGSLEATKLLRFSYTELWFALCKFRFWVSGKKLNVKVSNKRYNITVITVCEISIA